MSTPENDPLWFLSLDSLAKIVFDKKLWRLFENYLTTKRLVRAKLEEIAPIRNRIAHYRALHKDDLLRVVAVLRDIDEGFWKFCTSYNNAIWFAPPFTRDPIFKHFAARQHLGATRVSPGGYAVVGILMGVDVNVELRFSARPSARHRVSKIIGQRGYLYDFTFSTAHHHDDSGILDYPRILNATRQYHETVIHITLDSFQKRLRVTLPAVAPLDSIVQTAEKFFDACTNYRSGISYRRVTKVDPTDKDGREEYKESIRPYELIAAEWPHYVLPPNHPFTFLCPDMPCRFFQAV